MTARADRLTERAKGGDTRTAAEPAIPAHVLRVYIEAMHRLGYEVEPQFAQIGIRPSDLDRDPDARMPCAIWLPIMQRALQPRPLKNFLFKAAAAIPIGSFPLLDYLIVTSDSVGAAVRQLKRYLGLVDNPHVITIEDNEDPIRVVFVSRDGRPTDEFGIALVLLRLREEAGEAFRASSISFQHRPEDPAEIEQIFGCPVHACAAWNGVAISRSSWNLPLRRRDPILARLPPHAISRRHRSRLARSRTCSATPKPPPSIGPSGGGTNQRRKHFAHSPVPDARPSARAPDSRSLLAV